MPQDLPKEPFETREQLLDAVRRWALEKGYTLHPLDGLTLYADIRRYEFWELCRLRLVRDAGWRVTHEILDEDSPARPPQEVAT